MKRKQVTNWYEVRNESTSPELLIYGYIGPWDDIDFIGFNAALKEVAKKNTSVTLRIHSGGGSVLDGLAIYDALLTSGLQITVIIDGMAASMASVLSQVAPKGRRKINENGTIMIHRVRGVGVGNADDIRAYADLVDDREKRIKQIFTRTTGQTADIVNAWFAKNTDWWINAEEALALGLVDEIIKTDAPANKLPANKLEELSEMQVFEMLSNALNTDLTQNLNMNKLQILITAALAARGIKVADNATEEQILQAVTQVFTDLDNKLKGKDEERADALVNALVASGKLKADDAAGVKDLKDLAMSNYSLAVKFSEGLKTDQAPEPPKNVIVNVGTMPVGSEPANERDKWNYSDWCKNDSAGLQAMKNTDKDKFKSLYKAEYNEDFEG